MDLQQAPSKTFFWRVVIPIPHSKGGLRFSIGGLSAIPVLSYFSTAYPGLYLNCENPDVYLALDQRRPGELQQGPRRPCELNRGGRGQGVSLMRDPTRFSRGGPSSPGRKAAKLWKGGCGTSVAAAGVVCCIAACWLRGFGMKSFAWLMGRVGRSGW